jgi:hypothetical protein
MDIGLNHRGIHAPGFSVSGGGSTSGSRHDCSLPPAAPTGIGAVVHAGAAVVRQSGLVKLGHVALDGTKLKANASKHKAMSYERMEEKEKQLKAEMEKLLAQAAETDAVEDALYGKGKRGDELPAELARREPIEENCGSQSGAGARGTGGCRGRKEGRRRET